MLPTHFIQSSSSSSMIKQQVNGRETERERDSNHQSYPPTTSTSYHDNPSSSSFLKRILGKGGITSLTVTTEPPSSKPEALTSTSRSTSTSTPKPSLWRTPEFIFYYIVIFLSVSLMVWVPVDISNDRNPHYQRFSNHLKKGWLFGRKRDDSDFQYRSFRDYVFLLTLIMLIYLSISKLISFLTSSKSTPTSTQYRPLQASTSNTNANSNLNSQVSNRKIFLLGFISIFLIALHGSNSIKILSILTINYHLTRTFGGKKIGPVLIWSFNFGILIAVHWNNGFSWGKLLPILSFLDDYQGLLPRWQINFNITMLRLISFGLDWHWAIQTSNTNRRDDQTSISSSTPGPELNPRQRCSNSRPFDQYSFLNYLIYILYPPLLIAGPVMTFNDFTSQLYKPLPFSKTPVVRYAIRVLSSMVVMELILHFIWVNAIKDSKAWNGLSPLQLSMVGFWNLIIVWLKLLIPWRFFRLWALSDGVDPPENMVRCMANNYSTLGFWRSWHRSYNLWIVRYLYIPLGGSKNPIPSTLLVFTFVALWHDLSFKLLTWGWLVTFFVLPEMLARKLVPEKKFGSYPWYRHLSAFGGVVNVLMMMTANLVGFAIGLDGVKYMWDQILGSWEGIRFMVGTFGILFTGVQVMFEYREEELRQGISRKC